MSSPAIAYPEVGSVAIMNGGEHIEVLPNEGCDDAGFCGGNLISGEVSGLWDRSKIARLISPSEHGGEHMLKLSKRRIIREGEFIRFNGFYDVMTGALNRRSLRIAAARRLLSRGRIDEARAAELLRGVVPKGVESGVVGTWKATTSPTLPSTGK